MADILAHWLLSLLHLFVFAAAGLSFIIIIGFCAGRRGNGSLFIQLCKRGLCCLFWLSIIAVFYFICDYLFQTARFNNDWKKTLAPFFHLAGMPHSTSLAVWILGFVFTAFAKHSLMRVNSNVDKYFLDYVKTPLAFCLLSFGCFFASFCLINWPFGGLPEGVSLDAAGMAVFRRAFRNIFTSIGIAGAFSLVFTMFFYAEVLNSRMIIVKSLALLCVVGYLPAALQVWSLFLGGALGIAPSMANSPNFIFQIANSILLTFALCCWIGVFFKPALAKYLSAFGFGLLILKTSFPSIYQIYTLCLN